MTSMSGTYIICFVPLPPWHGRRKRWWIKIIWFEFPLEVDSVLCWKCYNYEPRGKKTFKINSWEMGSHQFIWMHPLRRHNPYTIIWHLGWFWPHIMKRKLWPCWCLCGWLKTQELNSCQSPAGTLSACLLHCPNSVLLSLSVARCCGESSNKMDLWSNSCT